MEYFKMKKLLLSASVCAFLTACGGGGSDSSATPAPTPEPPPTPTPSPTPEPTDSPVIGLWFGETATIDGGTAEIAAIISVDGQARFASLETKDSVKAQLAFDEGNFTSDSGVYFAEEVKQGDSEVSGTVDAGEMSGDVTVSGENLAFTMIRLDESDNTPSLDTVSGNYAADGISVGIDADGMITGSDDFGCLLTGQLSIPDDAYNIYELSLTVENCADINGEYNGLAAYGTVPFDGEDFTGLVFSVDNGEYSLSDYLLKAD